jgi:hypothetical protein
MDLPFQSRVQQQATQVLLFNIIKSFFWYLKLGKITEQINKD